MIFTPQNWTNAKVPQGCLMSSLSTRCRAWRRSFHAKNFAGFSFAISAKFSGGDSATSRTGIGNQSDILVFWLVLDHNPFHQDCKGCSWGLLRVFCTTGLTQWSLKHRLLRVLWASGDEEERRTIAKDGTISNRLNSELALSLLLMP